MTDPMGSRSMDPLPPRMRSAPFRRRTGLVKADLLIRAVVAEDAATVAVDHPDYLDRTYTGRAWKSRDDAPDPGIGYDLALGRALEAMGRDLQRRAWRSVQNKESR